MCAALRRADKESLTGVFLVSTIAEYHYVLTLVRLFARAVLT